MKYIVPVKRADGHRKERAGGVLIKSRDCYGRGPLNQSELTVLINAKVEFALRVLGEAGSAQDNEDQLSHRD